jgi:hypothetical protein
MSPEEVRAAMAVLFQYPIYCLGCNSLKGWLLPDQGELLLATGDFIRFPYALRCRCGRNVKWRIAHYRALVSNKEVGN